MHAADARRQILIVDQDAATTGPLRQALSAAGFAVQVTADGPLATALIAESPPHLMIFDWNTPGVAALDLIRSLSRTRVPRSVRLIILSALAAEQDIVAGLELGADDYIAKPFSLREVLTRCDVLLRPRFAEERSPSLMFGDLVLDTDTNRVTAGGRSLALRGIEYRLLQCFMSNPGRTFNRGELLMQVWGVDHEVDKRTVDVNVQRLRRLLSGPGYETCIQTVRGFGYRFAPPPQVTN